MSLDLLQNLPHHAGCVSGARDQVDATVIRRQAGHNVWKRGDEIRGDANSLYSHLVAKRYNNFDSSHPCV